MSQPVALMLRRVLRGRWFMLYGSFLIMSAAGASSVFAVYSRGIKQALGYTQEQLNTVGFFMDLGANVGVHAGLVAGAAPMWLVLSVGAAMSLGGYLMLYLSVVAGTSSRPTPLWLVCLYIVAGSNSQTFPHTAALVTCVSSFAPQSRGAMLGLLKGFLGLSGALYSQLYLAFVGGGGDTRPLILLVGCLPAAISIALLGTIRIIPAAAAAAARQPAIARREFRAFRSFLYLSLALATYLVVAIVLQRRFRLTSAEYRLSGGAVLAMLLVLPLVIVHREEAAAAALIDGTSESEITTATDDRQAASSCAVNAATSELSPPPSQAITAETKKRANAVVGALRRLGRRQTGPPPRGHDHTVLEALTSVDMLLLLTSSAIGVGGMLTATYNVGQIGESQGYPPGNTAAFVSLTSIWSYLGRVASGFASDAVLARRRLPTPLLLFAALLLAVPGHLLIAFGVPGALYPASIIIGFCYGATQPLTLAITSELFGLRYYSTLCTFGPAVYPIGTYIFNVRVAGRMYDREAARQGAAAGHAVATTCVGVRCYRESFKVVAVAAAAAAALALALAWRTREFYAGDINVKFGGAMGEQTGMDVISENGVVEEAGEKEHVSSATVE